MKNIENLAVNCLMDSMLAEKFGEDNVEKILEMCDNSMFPLLQKMHLLDVVPDIKDFFPTQMGKNIRDINYMTGVITLWDRTTTTVGAVLVEDALDNSKGTHVKEPQFNANVESVETIQSPTISAGIEHVDENVDGIPDATISSGASKVKDDSVDSLKRELQQAGHISEEEVQQAPITVTETAADRVAKVLANKEKAKGKLVKPKGKG